MDSREERLPAWCKELLSSLRQRVQSGNEPLLKELAMLRPKVADLAAKNNALTKLLFEIATEDGHVGASDIISVIEEYAPWKD